jgi:HEPN domain-containing protein/predicted nucleotidyltransferase
LPSLPQRKRDELERVIEIILKHAQVEMIILFGSHARSATDDNQQWVSHKYVKDGTVYEYNSDFDLLVIVKNKQIEQDLGVWSTIETEVYKSKVRTWLGMIVDNIHYVNEQLELGRYFYCDLVKEGIVLYDTQAYELAKPKELSEAEQKDLMVKDFDYWSKSASYFYDDYLGNLEKDRLKNAAFNLHQALERYFTTLLLVFTSYRPKSHDIWTLFESVNEIEPRFYQIFFPGVDEEAEKSLFEKLRKAYVDARYEADYEISVQELKTLGAKVKEIGDLIKSLCKDKISKI